MLLFVGHQDKILKVVITFQLDPPVAVPSSVPGHTPPPFGRFSGSGIPPPIPAAAAPFHGATLPPTVLSGDAYGFSNISERPKKVTSYITGTGNMINC